MNKIQLAFSTALLIFSSCKNTPEKSKEEEDAYYDSVSVAQTGKTIHERAIERTDSLLEASTKNVLLDTVGLYKAPVKVTKAVLFKKEYSSYRDIRLTYKNVSTKTIAAIKFRWMGTNAFGDPADMGTSMAEGFGSGFTDDILKPGKSETSEWGILSRDGKKVELAWPYEVAFTDGTKWEL